jgi:tRNA (cmo5U34)-methyltransferase
MGVASHLGIKLGEYDAVIRSLIPHYQELLDAAAQAVDTLGPRRPTVIDLGTGTGALASRLLAVRPRARIVGIDEDPGMLAVARKRLKGGITTVAANFEGQPIPACDIVSASFALHHIRTPQRKRALYKRAHRALKRGGMLVSADCFLSSDRVLQRSDRQSWIQHLRRRYSPAKAEGFLRAWAAEDVYFTLSEETGWLEDAGFTVDVVLRKQCFATVVARK